MFPFEHIITIDDKSKIPVYKQIAFSIINAIRNGILKPGTRLPGTRELANLLQVHRKTIIAAYDELDAQEWITIFPRRYVMVAENLPVLQPQKWSESITEYSYEGDLAIPFRQVGNVMKTEKPVSEIVIDDGYPDVRLSPVNDLLKTYRALTSRKYAIKNAHIGTAQGSLKLREELVSYLSETRGLNINTDNIIITHGAQMSIYLSARLLLNPQSSVIAGKPNYPTANKTFIETGAELIEAEVDDEGINTDHVEEICKKKKINAVYVVPHHHYPTTVTLSVERRMKLLELSRRFSFVIIEDDYDYDYHYSSSPYLPLASAHHDGNVIYIGSFSKILDPSLRIGFMVAPKNFIEQCTAYREIIDVGGDGYMQNALALLIKEGELKRHLNKAKKYYHQRRDFLDSLLRKQLSKYVSYSLPSGGMAIWVTLHKAYPVNKLSGNELKITRNHTELNAFRFGFASMNEDELQSAVNILENQLKKL